MATEPYSRIWSNLRTRRFRNRITRKAMAERLGCDPTWLDRMERNLYRGPAREVWVERYRVALDELIHEKRQARKVSRDGLRNEETRWQPGSDRR